MELDLQSKLDMWRSKALAGTLTLEESREIIAHLRAQRVASASKPAAASKSKAKSTPIDSDKMLEDLL